MTDLSDYELNRTPDETASVVSRTGSPRAWVAAGVLIVAAAIAAYLVFAWRSRPAAPAAATTSAPSRQTPTTLGGPADAITLPPLDASDALVRTLVGALSNSPVISAWLTTNGLIRNFTVVVSNVADGATPAKHLAPLRPSMPFRVVERDRAMYVDPRSYDRYTAIADAVASLDAAALARLYSTLKPRINEASHDLGSTDESFDPTLERAIVTLVDTPVPEVSPRLRLKGIGYAYDDERFESLTSAQKQLLRVGPRNMRVIQAKLREVGVALGIPATRLPTR